MTAAEYALSAAVAVPMIAAGVLLLLGHVLPRHAADIVATMAALFSAGACAVIAVAAGTGTVTQWFGGWGIVQSVPVGIAFVADRGSATIAGFSCFLFAASFVFSWGYFEKIAAHFQVLMLLFLAAMVGFCLTHDLFNLFVWFEIMSVTAFALTGYRLEGSALGGALNFTVTNSLGGFMILAGIGLLYLETGVLDYSALAERIAGGADVPVVLAAFCLIACGLLTKAAVVPLHFWLADAHAVAPTPACVIFSGAMVSVGVFGLGKLVYLVFAPNPQVGWLVREALLWAAIASALIGGQMALMQRHLKRLLAFSTIGHSGILLAGLASLSQAGWVGLQTYMIGHGLIKGALFMIAGILLASRSAIDEIALRGRGDGEIRPAGALMALGALALGGLPFGLLDDGFRLIGGGLRADGHGWAIYPLAVGAALTGAAVLRAAGRIFLGLGPDPGTEAEAPTEAEREDASRPFLVMVAPAVLLTLPAFLPWSIMKDWAATMVQAVAQPHTTTAAIGGAADLEALRKLTPDWLGPAMTLASILIALFSLYRARLPAWMRDGASNLWRPVVHGLQGLHSGLITDYVTWMIFGFASLAILAFLS